jgi:hypothetical protein
MSVASGASAAVVHGGKTYTGVVVMGPAPPTKIQYLSASWGGFDATRQGTVFTLNGRAYLVPESAVVAVQRDGSIWVDGAPFAQ